MKIGILSIQGDFDAHRKRLEELGAETVLVKTAADLEGIDGLVLPGGESTTHIKLLEEEGLQLNLSFVAMVSGARPLAFPVSWAGPSRELKFEITPEDRAFLQSLGIKYDEKEAGEETREYGDMEESEEEEEE